MRHKQSDTGVIRETYRKATELGLNLDDISDTNLVRTFAEDLRKLGSGGKGKWASSSVKHRLRKMGVLTPRSLTLTLKGEEFLTELEAEA